MSEIVKKAKREAELSKKSAKLQALPGVNISFTSTGLEAVSYRSSPSGGTSTAQILTMF